MVNVSVARRYARALLDVAAEQSVVERVSSQLERLAQAHESVPDLKDVLTNPAYTTAQRTQVVNALVEKLGPIEGCLGNLLKLLVDRSRIVFLPDIARVFRDMADEKAGRLRGKVTSAVALSPDLLAKLQASLEAATQRSVVLESKVDAQVIGGATAQVGSLVYDGSLRNELRELRRALSQG